MTALYRKYRPQRFDDVVGQESVVRTLRNAVVNDKVAHAYLFTGTKGTGKTTMAKLLAKAMNCEHGPTPDPCGTCESCVSIAEGRSMDVAEIDAASTRGIDDVREKIIDTVAFRPSMGTRRVYILDEAHQLTSAAFNALLKTIEEPPPHVLFAFCTTETHQMMPTVRDRCQRMSLAPPGVESLLAVLRRVADAEGYEVDDAALRAVARVAQGSFRNALGTLELLATAFDRTFTQADVLRHLGAVSEDVLLEMGEAILSGNAGAALVIVDRMAQQGGDVEQFARELAEHLRVLLLVLHGMDAEGLGVAAPDRVTAQAQDADERRLLAAIDCIADASTRIRVGSDPRLAVETALVRAAQGLGLPSLALRLAMLEQKLTGGYGQAVPAPGAAPAHQAAAHQAAAQQAAAPAQTGSAPAAPRQQAPAPAAPATRAATTASTSPAPPPPPASPAAAVATPAPAPSPSPATATGFTPAASSTPAPSGGASVDLDAPATWWPQIMAALPAHTRSMLVGLHPVSCSDGVLVLRSEGPVMLTDKARGALKEAAEAVAGAPLRIDLQHGPVAPAEQVPAAPAPEPGAAEDPRELADQAIDAPPGGAPPTPAPAESADGGEGLAAFQKAFDATELPAQR